MFWYKRHSSASNRLLRNLLFTLIVLLLYIFLYSNLPTSRNNVSNPTTKEEQKPIDKDKVAFIYIEDSNECLLVEFTKHLISSLKMIEPSRSKYSFHVFALHKQDQPYKCHYSEPFVTNILFNNQSSSKVIDDLENLLNSNSNDFSSVVILQKCVSYSDMWLLSQVASKLSSKIPIYSLLHSTLANPNLEIISVVRLMSMYSKYIIVMSWFDYYSLISTYGIEETNILYIPHGITIPTLSNNDKTSKSISSLLKYKNEDFVLLLTDDISLEEDYKRLFDILKLIISEMSHLHLLIISHTLVISDTQEIIKSVQLEDRVTIINKQLSREESDMIYRRANAYISIGTKMILNPKDLLNAMSYGLPILSISDLFANEMLLSNRGLIISSADDDTTTVKSIITFLKDPLLLNTSGKKAREFGARCMWNNVARQYEKLLRIRSFEDKEEKRTFMKQLVNDPYENQFISWSNSDTMHSDDQDTFSCLKKNHKSESMIYTIYVDSFVQLNAKVNKQFEIELIGMKTLDMYVTLHKNDGIEDFKMNTNNFTYSIQINHVQEKIFYASNNVQFEISRSNGVIKMQFIKINRFLKSFGLIGATIRQRNLFMGNRKKESINCLKWMIVDGDLFSHNAEGQRISMYGIEYNIFILSRNTLRQSSPKNSRKIRLRMEGDFFDKSGFTTVNRRMYLSLIRSTDLAVEIKTSQTGAPSSDAGIEMLITYSLYLRQISSMKTNSNQLFHQAILYKGKTIVFRNGWPPNTNSISANEIVIHQQPIEFYAVPKDWINYFEHRSHELWIPSKYCQDAYIANGVSSNKVHLIPHGVFVERYKQRSRPFIIPTKKSFKFLTVGGMLARKGMDILFDAYLNLFTNKDDVTLIIVSLYTDGSADIARNKLQSKNANAPEIIEMNYGMPDIEMIRLYQSVDVYISPYRGEGFGLSILEAMAAGVPVIVTKWGPALDFVPSTCGYFVEASVVECLTSHCGKMKIFGADSSVQAIWAEPKVESLRTQMHLAYNDRAELKKRSKICEEHTKEYSWDKVAEKINKRLSEII